MHNGTRCKCLVSDFRLPEGVMDVFVEKTGSTPKPFPISSKLGWFSPFGTRIVHKKFGDDECNTLGNIEFFYKIKK